MSALGGVPASNPTNSGVVRIPSQASFAVRVANASGADTQVFSVDSNGKTTLSGRVDAGGGFRVTGPVHPTTGEGVEITWSTAFHIGYVQAYDWDAAAFKPLNLQGSQVSINYGTTPRIVVDSNGIGIDAAIYHPLDLTTAYGTAGSGGTNLGDKLILYGTGATFFGFGVQASALVAAVPSGSSFVVRPSSGTGAATSGTDKVTLGADGTITTTAGITSGSNVDVGGLVRAQGASFPVAGQGVELIYSSGTGIGYIQAYDRGGAAYKALNIQGESVSFNYQSTPRISLNVNGIGFYGNAPIAKPTGVAVTAAGIHAALVSLGLIAA